MKIEEFKKFITENKDNLVGFIGDGIHFSIDFVTPQRNTWKIGYNCISSTAEELFNKYHTITFIKGTQVEVKKIEYYKIEGEYDSEDIECLKLALKNLSDSYFEQGHIHKSKVASNLLEVIEENIKENIKEV